jgi:hypothetical protein
VSDDYSTVNRASWDERAPAHAASPDYALERFRADRGFLSEVVRFDLPLLGSIDGARGCICSVISGPTRSPCPGWAPG